MIELKNVTCGYNNNKILENINLTFDDGVLTGIIGVNGCGKSTLLKTIGRLTKPQNGEILFDGVSQNSIGIKEFAKIVTVLPQLKNVPNINVYSLVMHGRYPYLGFSRKPTKVDFDMVDYALSTTKTEKLKNKNMMELSGGEVQRVYFAMVIAQNTKVILLDEPTTYLDINHQIKILEIIKKLKSEGKTILMAIHDIGQALNYSEKICVINNGEVSYETSQDIYDSGIINKAFRVESKCISIDKKKYYHFF